MSVASKPFPWFCLVLCLCVAGCGRTQGSAAQSHPAVPVSAAPASPVSPAAPSAQPKAVSSPDVGSSFYFSGEVSRGERLQKEVPGNLVFRLNPYAEGDSGWRIEILPDTVPLPEDFDCSGSVTPPAHGPSGLFLDRPDGMTAEKKAQWNPHEFNFVANPGECKLAWDFFNEEEYPSNLSDEQKKADEQKFAKILTGTGTLTIVDSRLGPPSAGEEYGPILWIRFDVTLNPSKQPATHPEQKPGAN